MPEVGAVAGRGVVEVGAGLAAAYAGPWRRSSVARLRMHRGRRSRRGEGTDLSVGTCKGPEGARETGGFADVAAETHEIADTIVVAARRGDHQAFAAIVEHYDDRLRALAFHVLGDSQALDDALQEAYVKAYRGLRAFRGSASLGTWLHRLTYTTCLNIVRARSRHPVGTGTEAPEVSDSRTDPAELVASVDGVVSLLARLPVEQRAAIVLIDAHGHTYAEAAEILGIPPGTVASRLVSAREKLRGALSAVTDDLAPSARTEVQK